MTPPTPHTIDDATTRRRLTLVIAALCGVAVALVAISAAISAAL
jgi:hypothetical protein